jgi:hypothetical protein
MKIAVIPGFIFGPGRGPKGEFKHRPRQLSTNNINTNNIDNTIPPAGEDWTAGASGSSAQW